MIKKIFPLGCALVLSAVTSIAAAAVPVGYTVTELNVGAGTTSYATGLNDLGQVIGTFQPIDDNAPWGSARAFISNGVSTTIPTLDGHSANQAMGVNNAGVVVGRSFVPGRYTPSRGFVYNGAVTDLGDATGRGINNRGDIISADSPNMYLSQVFLHSGGTTTDIGTLGGSFTWASQINDKGQIVGGSTTSGMTGQLAYVYENGAMRSLGTLGGSGSAANGINNFGHIVGTADIAGDGRKHAFLYVDGVMTDLGNIGILADLDSTALAINDSGDVIGRAYGASGSLFFLYSDGVVTDLSTLLGDESGWTIENVAGINASGQIAVTAFKEGAGSQAIRLDPVSVVPEPATYGMLGVGLLLIAARSRRK